MQILYNPFQFVLENEKSSKRYLSPHHVRSGNVDFTQFLEEITSYGFTANVVTKCK